MEKRILSQVVTHDWYESIYNINPRDWNRIYRENVIKSYEFFQSQYDAQIPNASFLFLTVSFNNRIVAIAPCFIYKLDLAVIASPLFRKVCNFLRKWKKDFLIVKVFGVGSLASTCENHVEIIDGLDPELHSSVCRIISGQIKKKSKQLKINLVLIKEIPEHDLPKMKEILPTDFYFYDSLPSSIIPLFEEIPPYPNGLKRKERYRYRKLKQTFDEKYYWEKVINFTDMTKIFEEFYLSTLGNSQIQFEIMNENFFRNINENLKENSFLLIAKDRNGTIHSMGLVLEDEDSLIPLYIGLNYNNSAKELKLIHINSMYRVIEEAVENKKEMVWLGQNSNYSKILCGAYIIRVFLGFYSYQRFLGFCIKHLFGQLFTPTKVLQNVYKTEINEQIRCKFQDLNIFTVN